MMKFRFIGQYTNGHTSISSNGHVFVDREPTEVEDAEAIRRLSNNVEFGAVEDVVEQVDTAFRAIMAEAQPPKRRGRKPKAAD